MGVEEVIETYIDDLQQHFETIRGITKRVVNEKDNNSKANIAKEADETIQAVEEIFTKKFTEKILNRSGARKEEFQGRRQECEDTYERLKKNLNDALKLSSGTTSEPVRQNQNKQSNQEEDPDAIQRKEERKRRREQEEKEKQQRILLESSNQPDEVKEILVVQDDILASLARSMN